MKNGYNHALSEKGQLKFKHWENRYINISHFLVSSMKKSSKNLNSSRKIGMNWLVIHNKGYNLWKIQGVSKKKKQVEML